MLVMRGIGLAALLIGLQTVSAAAQIKIGAIISITGPTAALGVGYRSAFETFPSQIVVTTALPDAA